MRIVQISDTHGLHHRLTDLPAGDVLVHCGDFCNQGDADEALDFINWFIEQPYSHKLFVTGNHDTCLWDAEGIEDLPKNVHFLQDRGVVIDGVSFFGLGCYHCTNCIPDNIDVLVTHEPPEGILDVSNKKHWGSIDILQKVLKTTPKYHLFGHAHEAYGILRGNSTVFSNAALTDNSGKLLFQTRLLEI